MRARGDWSSLLHFEAATGFERGQIVKELKLSYR
jgi:hypothetical protein